MSQISEANTHTLLIFACRLPAGEENTLKHMNESRCPDSTFQTQDDLDEWKPSQSPTNKMKCYLQVEKTIT